MNTRSFIWLALALGAAAMGLAAGMEFARRVCGARCDERAAAEREESEAVGAPQTPEANSRKLASAGR